MKIVLKINFVITILFCCCFSSMKAQITVAIDSSLEDNIALRSRYYGDSIVLRWAFREQSKWRLYDSTGFIIERLELDETNKPTTDKFIQQAFVKPWTEQMFLTNTPADDSLAKIAGQCLYGKNFSMQINVNDPTQSLKDAVQVEQNRFLFAQFVADLSARAAEGLGWRWVDKNVKPNRKYIYRMFCPTKEIGVQIDSASCLMSTKIVQKLERPYYFKIENLDRNVKITWAHNEAFTAYQIEKSNDGINFKPAVKGPYIGFTDSKRNFVEFKDSLEKNYELIYYRVRGLDAFGDKSNFSVNQMIMGRDLTPASAPVVMRGEIDRTTRQVLIEWDWQGKDVADLKGFYITFSPNVEGPYQKIVKEPLSKSERKFMTDVKSGSNNGYYQVVSVDTAGNESPSYFKYIFLADLDPPSKPKGLVGKIDTNGIVKISWKAPIETDVKGYVVQFANALDHPFVGRSKGVVEDTVFTDSITLHTLTEKIYYRIAAVDLNENVSDFSNILALKKPDIIKPVPPNFYDYRATDSTIFLAWHPSQSEDAVKQRLYRKLANDTDTWKVIAEMDNTKNTFTDKPPTVDLYAYSIEAEDDDGLRSLQNDPIFLKIVDDKKLKLTPQLVAVFDEKTKTVHLSWQFAASQKINYLLYRAVDDLPLQHIKTIAGEIRTFDDAKVVVGTKYRYAIKAIENNERESKISEAVKVLVN